MQGRLAHKAHGSLAFAAALLILCCRVDGVAGYSKVGVESDGELSLEELAGFGTLSGGVMEEVQRLASAGRKDAVQAIIDGTSAMAVAHRPDGEEMTKHMHIFETAMHGETFMESEDTAENSRYRRALFIALCRTLAEDAKKLKPPTPGSMNN